MHDPVATLAVRASLDDALVWMREAKCRDVLTDFNDENGCPLADRLEQHNVSFENVFAVDRHPGCDRHQEVRQPESICLHLDRSPCRIRLWKGIQQITRARAWSSDGRPDSRSAPHVGLGRERTLSIQPRNYEAGTSDVQATVSFAPLRLCVEV
ncbi:MAG TPA: hypothetical protein VFR51_06960 [Pyrinomonadaceae bacterium]|nr:hypothetical protein [Pyrinomonadaceae bacterium]